MPSNEVSSQKNIYTYSDLSTFGGTFSYASAINNAGQIVGSDTKNEVRAKFATDPTYAVIWDNSYYVPKTTILSGHDSRANGINNFSTIVGSSLQDIHGNSQITATVWQGGETRYLESLSNGQYQSEALAINDQGVIVGESNTSNSWQDHHATLWNDKGATDLGTLGGKYSTALAINNAGTVAGWASTGDPDDIMHPVIWEAGKIINLSPTHIGGANGINNNGMVVGFVIDDEHFAHATLWINKNEFTLPGTAGSYSYTTAINNKNQIVGTEMTSTGQHALLWNGPDSAPINLDQYLNQSQHDAGWHLTGASAINDNGWITGLGYNTKTNECHAFLLTPDGVAGLTGAAPAQASQATSLTPVATVTSLTQIVVVAAPVMQDANTDIWSGNY
jgi:probable HAF family extracellular repeat protein